MVALALVSLMSLAMFQAYRLAQRSLVQATRVDGASRDVAGAQRFLRRVLEQAYPFEPASNSAPVHALEGETSRLMVTGPALAAEGSMGYQRFELSLDGHGELAVSWFLDRNGKPSGQGQAMPARDVLLTGVKSISISYLELVELGNGQFEPHWLDSWIEMSKMPALIRFHLDFADGEHRSWPELIVAPRITTDANCVFDVVSQACRMSS